MARINFTSTLGGLKGLTVMPATYTPDASAGGDPAASAISTTNVAADVATLVADAATPTQAHVTTLSGHWTTLLAAITGQTVANTGDVSVSVDKSVVTSYSQFKACLDAILRAAQGSGQFTA